uniref:M-phase inducer phosphatase n=1 Tax=Amblyomma maculatum TaxID=34609 RepID=G3MTW5_AMBMU
MRSPHHPCNVVFSRMCPTGRTWRGDGPGSAGCWLGFTMKMTKAFSQLVAFSAVLAPRKIHPAMFLAQAKGLLLLQGASPGMTKAVLVPPAALVALMMVSCAALMTHSRNQSLSFLVHTQNSFTCPCTKHHHKHRQLMHIKKMFPIPVTTRLPVLQQKSWLMQPSPGIVTCLVPLLLLNSCLAFKRPVSPGDQPSSPSHKRHRYYQLQRFTSYTEPSCSLKVSNFSRSFSDTDASIKLALQKSDADPDLIGDFSKPYALPLVKGKHHDLKMILPSTLADVLQGKYISVVDEVTIVDCRYPFEYEGGHIKGAVNVFSSEDLLSEFLEKAAPSSSSRRALVFHCEFSSERGPKLSRLLREKDRQMNKYPALKHPEIYVLEGGYKAFYENFQDLCIPQGYIPMRHKGHEADLRWYRSMTKTEAASSKSRGALQIRSIKKF